MTVVKLVGAAALALLAGMWAEGAKARAETFICEGGRLVKATPVELEQLKRTDECIARYFGLSVADVETSLDATAAADPVKVAAVAGAPVPPAPVPAVRSKSAMFAGATAPAPAAVPAEEPQPAKPRPYSDHRTVLIINAQPGSQPYLVTGR